MSLDDLSASSQAQDWGAGVRLGIHLARQAVLLAYEKVESEDVNTANTDKLGIAHDFGVISESKMFLFLALIYIASRYEPDATRAVLLPPFGDNGLV